MSRLILLTCAPLLLLFGAACGGDGDDDPVEPTQTPGGPTATPTPKLLPTPPAATDADVILQAGAGETLFAPTLAEFRELPTIEIDADGKRKGVSLAEIGRRVSATEDTYVTLQGYRRDGRKIVFVRELLSEVGEQSVLVLNESGHLDFYSSALAEDQWLVNVSVVSFP